MTRRMYKLWVIVGMLLTLVVAFTTATHANSISTNTPFEQYLYPVSSYEEAEFLTSIYPVELVDYSPYGPIAQYRLLDVSMSDTLLANGFVYNQVASVSRPPFQSVTDPYLKDQYAISLMETNLAWGITTGTSSVIVAIIDTGIDTAHPEFINRIHPNSYNSKTKEVGITKVVDDFGHGTMVAGIIGAIKDNSKGIAGIAPNISLLIIKANNEDVGSFQDSSIIEGIYYAVDQGAQIINLSLGGTYANPQTKVAIDYATAHGVIVVAASGNDGISTPMYPAAFEEVISVGAIDSSKTIASYSNFGATIDIVAPGSDIITTVRNSGYGSGSGTSFAAPQVAGVLALVLSHQSGLSVGELRARLTQTALDRGTIGYDELYGYGIVNTYKSVITDFHKVSFETSGGSLIPSIYMAHNSVLSELPSPTKENQIFEGWFLDESYTIPFQPQTSPLVEDITLYAKFNSSFHTVFYYDQSTLLRQEIIPHGEEFSTYIPTFEDRVFEGWFVDEQGLIPYEMSPVTQDVKLYAKTRGFYIFTYTLYLNEEIVNELQVTEGQEPNLPNMEEVGYLFDGWYVDIQYSTKYEILPSVEDVTLYARRELITFDIVFYIDGLLWKQITLPYGSIIDEEVQSIEGQRFMGWYLDETYSQLYEGEGIRSTLELYGKWVSEVIDVFYIINGSVWKEEVIEVGTSLQVSSYLQEGYTFYGWYVDEAYSIPYESKSEMESVTLYGYTEIKSFVVSFYDIFGNLFETKQVSYGENLEAQTEPSFPKSPWLTFTFIGWDKELINITSNMDIFPLIEVTFQASSLQLNPGIDTILKHGNWTDTGVNVDDSLIRIQVIGEVDTSTLGKYTIVYELYFQEQKLAQMTRIIRVIDTLPPITITLNPGISTIIKGQEYIEAGAKSTGYDIEIYGSVNSLVTGIYPIVYRVVSDNQVVQVTRFVHVIEDITSYINVLWWYEKKEVMINEA